MIVAVALAEVAVVLAAESAAALASGSRPGSSAVTLASAAVSLAVLAPLAAAKRRTGRRMGSQALMGDGAPSGIGAATSLLALAALALNDTLGWWWADRVAALAVVAVAAAEAWHTMPAGTLSAYGQWLRGFDNGQRTDSAIQVDPVQAQADGQPGHGRAKAAD